MYVVVAVDVVVQGIVDDAHVAAQDGGRLMKCRGGVEELSGLEKEEGLLKRREDGGDGGQVCGEERTRRLRRKTTCLQETKASWNSIVVSCGKSSVKRGPWAH